MIQMKQEVRFIVYKNCSKIRKYFQPSIVCRSKRLYLFHVFEHGSVNQWSSFLCSQRQIYLSQELIETCACNAIVALIVNRVGKHTSRTEHWGSRRALRVWNTQLAMVFIMSTTASMRKAQRKKMRKPETIQRSECKKSHKVSATILYEDILFIIMDPGRGHWPSALWAIVVLKFSQSSWPRWYNSYAVLEMLLTNVRSSETYALNL